MRATVMYGAGDVRIDTVPNATLIEPTDALVRVTRSAICGSDLWPYQSMEPSETGRRMGHEFMGVGEAVGAVGRVGVPQEAAIPDAVSTLFRNVTISGGVAPARAYIEELLPDVIEGNIEPGRVFYGSCTSRTCPTATGR